MQEGSAITSNGEWVDNTPIVETVDFTKSFIDEFSKTIDERIDALRNKIFAELHIEQEWDIDNNKI